MIIEPDPPPAAKPASRDDAPPPKNPHQSTLVLEPEFEPTSLPFQRRKAKGGTAELDTRTGNAGEAPPPNVMVRPASGSLSSTLDIMEDTQDAASLTALGEEQTLLKGQKLVDDDARVMLDEPTAKPTSSEEAPTPRHEPPPPAPARAPSAPPPPPRPRSEPPPEPEPPPPEPPPRPAPPARPAPRTNVANDLYKRFKK
jgi:hypothetical protein